MIKIWVRIIKNNKIIDENMQEIYDDEPSISLYLDTLRDICYELDLEYPVVLNKHKLDMVNFCLVKFLPEDFMDRVEFDRLEIEIFIEKDED